MAGENKAQIKNLAKKAKERLKNRFWENYCENVTAQVEKAREEGENTSKVISYYKSQAARAISDTIEKDEEFYLKVKSILDLYGEVSDILGRLCDLEYMNTLNYQQKERYISNLAEKYRSAKERYDQEKRFSFKVKAI